MKTIIIYKSIHHKNTEKVAKVMAEVLGAKLVQPEEVNYDSLANYDLIGFGSGIYMNKHHRSLVELVKKLPLQNKKAFVFSTCGVWRKSYHEALLETLAQKHFIIKGEFSCNGWDTWGPFKFIGGLKKDHPNEKDFNNARIFAKSLIE